MKFELIDTIKFLNNFSVSVFVDMIPFLYEDRLTLINSILTSMLLYLFSLVLKIVQSLMKPHKITFLMEKWHSD